RKELRNPFNVILALMCLDPVVPLIIRISMGYRNLWMMTECSKDMVNYSLALFTIIEFCSWAPFRATYTWLAVVLTVMRFRALRSKGKWQASYAFAIVSSSAVALLAVASSVPMFSINVIGEASLGAVCER
ncbi:hypothetical protein PMAYCL1PPCAC_21523, partial [Pristionchus mayeri]